MRQGHRSEILFHTLSHGRQRVAEAQPRHLPGGGVHGPSSGPVHAASLSAFVIFCLSFLKRSSPTNPLLLAALAM